MDQSPGESRDMLLPGVLAGVVMGVLGVGVWMLFYKIGSSGFAIVGWLSAPVIGLGVGLAIRQIAQTRRTQAADPATLITFASSAVGYVVTDMVLVPWQPPSDLPQALRNFGGDIQAWLLIAIGCYIAYALSRRPVG